MTTALVLAHQGGWDEILLVLTPVSLFAGLLWLANRRANAQVSRQAEAAEAEAEAPEAPAGGDDAAAEDDGDG